MKVNRKTTTRTAFTLIELMVVVAIIGILIGVLLPAFGVIRTNAKKAQVTAQFQAIDTGIAMYQGALGNALPPSASDDPDDHQMIFNPRRLQPDNNNGDQAEVRISGAHLLVHALMGADGLGPPGFKDFGNGGRDGLWHNDTHDAITQPYGAYALNPSDGNTRHSRYGSNGFVDENMKESAKSLTDLANKGVIININQLNQAEIASDELLFVDSWDHPILYYRSSRGSNRMTADLQGDVPGIFRQEDNGIITGSVNSDPNRLGLDFGAGINGNVYHPIADAASPPPTSLPNFCDAGSTFENTFACFIRNEKITVRPTPVNKDSYLLISAGKDGQYGTTDDLTNWTRDLQ